MESNRVWCPSVVSVETAGIYLQPLQPWNMFLNISCKVYYLLVSALASVPSVTNILQRCFASLKPTMRCDHVLGRLSCRNSVKSRLLTLSKRMLYYLSASVGAAHRIDRSVAGLERRKEGEGRGNCPVGLLGTTRLRAVTLRLALHSSASEACECCVMNRRRKPPSWTSCVVEQTRHCGRPLHQHL